MVGARHRDIFCVVVLVLLVAAAHGSSLWFGFVMDDWPQIVQNEHLGQLGLADAFLKGTMANSALSAQAGDSYRPVFVLWLAGLARLAGSEPFGWHLANLILHILATLMLWRLALRLMAPVGAMAAASLFAVHPALAQSVSWISGATDPLLTLWVLGAMLCHLDWRARRQARWLAGTVSLYALALLTKETALLLPLLLVGLDRLLGLPWRRSLPLALLGVVVVGWAVLRAQVLGAGAGEAELALAAAGFRRLADYGFYALESTIFPWPQPYLFLPPATQMTSMAVLPALGVLGCLLYAAGLRASLFAGGWVLVFLTPPLLIAFHEVGAFAFRFLYLPMAGIALLAGVAVVRVRLIRPDLLAPVIALVGLVGIAGSVAAAQDWRDDETFYSLVIRSAPETGSGYYGLARHWERQGDSTRQEAVFRQAVASVVDANERLSLLESLGILLAQNGRHAESLQVFRQLTALPAGRLAGLVGSANVHWMMGDLMAALGAYDEALRLAPSDRTTRMNRDRLLALTRKAVP